MTRARALVATLLAITAWPVAGQSTSQEAAAVLERAIAYHDHKGRWETSRFQLSLEESRPNGSSRHTRLVIDNARDSFEILTDRKGAEIEGLMAGEDCVWTLDGSIRFTDEQRDKHKLTCERLTWLRNYYTYLWGLPMKLLDPGTRLDPRVSAETYQDRQVWTLRVTYDETVGSDTWYFYFDRKTYALVGYRFYHDETKRDGEYILLEGEVEVEGVKIPRRRSWYTNAEDRHLGDDLLVELEITP